MLTDRGKEGCMSRNQGAQPFEVSLHLPYPLSLRVYEKCQDRVDIP
jgi:hypothetical protein